MGGSPCDGSLRLLKSCDMGKCPAKEEEVAQNCEYGAWSLWSKCAGETDQQVYRTRYISKFASGKGEKCDAQLMETRGCDTDPHRDVDCLFSVWSGWSACPVSCGGGQNTRSRSIQEHARGHGKVCEGALLEASACGDVQCPGEQIQARESCETSDWSGWRLAQRPAARAPRSANARSRSPRWQAQIIAPKLWQRRPSARTRRAATRRTARGAHGLRGPIACPLRTSVGSATNAARERLLRCLSTVEPFACPASRTR